MLMLVICVLLSSICSLAAAQQPWAPDEFPISFWSGPPAAQNTLEAWQTVKDCNFTYAGTCGGYTREDNLKRLDLCEKVGLKALVVDQRLSWTMVADENWQDIVRQVVADYSSHPAFYGYFLRDEPNHYQFDALGQISREFEAQDPAHLPYINLFPTYANVAQLGTPTYADHLDKFLRVSTPRVLSYDHYCLLKAGGIRPDYFENLELVREAGLRHGVPPWQIILSVAHLSYRDPTEAEMRWQVNTSLAYGMKGLMYFTYWTNRSRHEAEMFAIVDWEGKPKRLYPIVQKLNAEVRTIGKVLLGLTSTGVYHTGDVPPGCRRLGTESIIRLPEDAPLIVGYFVDAEGAEYAMIVNKDYAEPVDVEAKVLPHVVDVTNIPASDASSIEVDGRTLRFTLAPGDARLLRLHTEFEYPAAPEIARTIDFQFDRPGDPEGWAGHHGSHLVGVKDSILSLGLSSRDPFFSRSFLRVPPDHYTKIKIRMRITSGEKQGQLFWATGEERAFKDDKYMNFPIVPDGEWHEYEIPVGEHAKWKGQEIRALRLDPTTGGSATGASAQIDWIIGE